MLKEKINKKRVLITAPKWYSYPQMIKSALEELGYEAELVIYHKRKICMPIFPKSKILWLRKIYALFKDDFADFSRFVEKSVHSFSFDYVLSINTAILSISFINKLQAANADVKTIWYLWDSLTHYELKKYISNYKKVYTFDSRDAQFFGITYKPNFWYNESTLSDNSTQYDLFFIGTFTEERADTLVRIWNTYPQLNKYFRIIVLKRQTYERYCKNKTHEFISVLKDMVSFEYIEMEMATRLLLSSRCVLDVESYVQYGLSQRNILALAHGKKLLTTNRLLLARQQLYQDQVRNIKEYYNDMEEWLNKDIENKTLIMSMQRCEVHQWIEDLLT